MSILGLASEAAQQKIETPPPAASGSGRFARRRGPTFSSGAPAPAAASQPPVATSTTKPKATVQTALADLVRYVPVEVVTLYLAAVSVGPAFKAVISWYTPMLLYWGFVVMTPVFFYLVYFNQRIAMGEPIPNFKKWPVWKPMASTIAFIVWALAIPNNPYIQGEGSAAVAGFAVIFVSILLSLVSPIIERKT